MKGLERILSRPAPKMKILPIKTENCQKSAIKLQRQSPGGVPSKMYS